MVGIATSYNAWEGMGIGYRENWMGNLKKRCHLERSYRFKKRCKVVILSGAVEGSLAG